MQISGGNFAGNGTPLGQHSFKMTTNRRAFLLGGVAALGCGRRRATGFPGYAFVANAGEQSVAAVDLMDFSVVRQIRLSAAPDWVTAHAARRINSRRERLDRSIFLLINYFWMM